MSRRHLLCRCCSSWIIFFSSSMRSRVSFRTIRAPGVSISPRSPRLRLGDSTFSNRSAYWRAQFFWENQSFGRLHSPKGRIALLTDTQFWSPLLNTDDARHSRSRVDHISVAVCLRRYSERRSSNAERRSSSGISVFITTVSTRSTRQTALISTRSS